MPRLRPGQPTSFSATVSNSSASRTALTTVASEKGLRTTETAPASRARSAKPPASRAKASDHDDRDGAPRGSARRLDPVQHAAAQGRAGSGRAAGSRASSTASIPLRASSQTEKPASSSTSRRSARTIGSSSTVNTVAASWNLPVVEMRAQKKARARGQGLEARQAAVHRRPATQDSCHRASARR